MGHWNVMRSWLAFRAVPVVVSSHQVRACVGTLTNTATVVVAAAHGQGGPPALLQHGAGPLSDRAVCYFHVPLTVFTAASAHHCRRPLPGLAGRTASRGLFQISRGQAGREGWAWGREIAQARPHQGQLTSLADGGYGQVHGPRPPLQPPPEQWCWRWRRGTGGPPTHIGAAF